MHCSHRPAEVEGRPQGGDGVAGRQHLLAAPVAPPDVERVVDDARGRLGQLGGDGGVAAGTKKVVNFMFCCGMREFDLRAPVGSRHGGGGAGRQLHGLCEKALLSQDTFIVLIFRASFSTN